MPGKPRKLVNNKAWERESSDHCSASTLDGRVVLRVVKQPESQHRARYLTEGSRGSVKDQTGSGFPTVALEGCAKPAKLQIYVGSETSGEPTPHLFYQVCRVAGKSPAGCREIRENGTNYLEMSADTRHGNLYICDSIGILKERYSDVEGRFPNDSAWKEAKRKSTQCRLVFLVTVESSPGNLETLQVASHLINCCQPPGTPEMLKLNTLSSPMRGGGELWIIGKNFLKDTKVSFCFIKPGAEEPTWTKIVSPLKEYFHQNHLIVVIPPFFDHLHYDVQVLVSVLSSGKRSDPMGFTYKAELAALAVTRPSDKRKGKISVIKSLSSLSPPGRPTILEPLHCHENKRARRDQTVRRGHVTHTSQSPLRTIRGSLSNYSLTRRSSSGESSNEENSHWQSGATEEVNIFPSNGEFSSNLTMDFSNFFKNKRNEVEEVKPVSGEQICPVQDSNQTAWKLEPTHTGQEETQPTNISYEKTQDEKATISISLPSSIFKDQKHLHNIMETINTTLLRPEEEERYQRKRLYDEKESGEWEELKSVDKKWNADINEILQTVTFDTSSAAGNCEHQVDFYPDYSAHSPDCWQEAVEVEVETRPATDLHQLIEQAESDNFQLG